MRVLKLLSKLPLAALYLFSDLLFVVSYYLLRYRRKVVWINLTNSFPLKSKQELRLIEKQFYRNLCDYGVETLKLLTISQAELSKRMKYKNPEVIGDFARNNQSVILLASHQFNWEWMLVAGSFCLPVPIDFVYQVQGSNFFNNLCLLTRTRFGAHPILRQQVAREIIKRKDLLRGIAIVADQFPGHNNDKRYWTDFMDQDTAFFQSINQLVTLTQYPAFFCSIKRVARGYYELELIKISDPPYDKETFHIIDRYVKSIEALITKHPDGWLWSHNRWKKNREEADN